MKHIFLWERAGWALPIRSNIFTIHFLRNDVTKYIIIYQASISIAKIYIFQRSWFAWLHEIYVRFAWPRAWSCMHTILAMNFWLNSVKLYTRFVDKRSSVRMHKIRATYHCEKLWQGNGFSWYISGKKILPIFTSPTQLTASLTIYLVINKLPTLIS